MLGRVVSFPEPRISPSQNLAILSSLFEVGGLSSGVNSRKRSTHHYQQCKNKGIL